MGAGERPKSGIRTDGPARSRARGSREAATPSAREHAVVWKTWVGPGTLQLEMSTRQEGDGSRADAPLGKARSIGWTILLSIVTLGIWTCIWSFSNGGELKRYRPDGLGGGVYLVLAIFISPVVMFLMAGEVAKLYEEAGEEPPIRAIWGLWFLLPLIGNIIWYVRIQNSLNDYWTDSSGPTITRSTRTW